MRLEPSTIAAIRFGYGFRAGEAAPSGPGALLAQLRRGDQSPRHVRFADTALRTEALIRLRDVSRSIRKDEAGARDARQEMIQDLNRLQLDDMRWLVARAVGGRAGLRERLVSFWSDHFTVEGTSRSQRIMVPDMINSAIRPHVTGAFPDMLKAVTYHPAMLSYLNQIQSFGPNSTPGKRRGRGLNENLAREILELHTLGVGGPYGQQDVREFAELLTGLSMKDGRFHFRQGIAEPGAETVLGTRYGGKRPQLEHIGQALEDLALHPATARHLAAKLIVHFIGIPPEQGYVDRLARAYLRGDGALMPIYAALLEDDRAWAGPFHKAKTPFDFVVSTFRAAGAQARDVMGLSPREVRQGIVTPLGSMGQPPFRPGGPDGWPEEPENWITPAGLAARIRWAQAVADRRLAEQDPRIFLEVALRDVASPVLRRAVAGAEQRDVGIALVLASPEFNRR